MTTDMMTLRALLATSSDAGLLREMLAFGAERLMELEVEQHTGAGHGERSPLPTATATGCGAGRPGPDIST